jgi:UDP-N-acetyl-D-mannosaminuronic acid transferase (WecB/TagA/CpsF family)
MESLDNAACGIAVNNADLVVPNVILVRVGAVFDFLSGEKAIAPEWIRAMGM